MWRMVGAYQLVHLHPIAPTWGARASGRNGPSFHLQQIGLWLAGCAGLWPA